MSSAAAVAAKDGGSMMSKPTTTNPRALMAKAVKVAGQQRSMFVKLTSPFMARCERHGCEFLMEVAATDSSQQTFVIRLQRHKGDAGLFREIAYRILYQSQPPAQPVVASCERGENGCAVRCSR